jgi:hypothetical protein
MCFPGFKGLLSTHGSTCALALRHGGYKGRMGKKFKKNKDGSDKPKKGKTGFGLLGVLGIFGAMLGLVSWAGE